MRARALIVVALPKRSVDMPGRNEEAQTAAETLRESTTRRAQCDQTLISRRLAAGSSERGVQAEAGEHGKATGWQETAVERARTVLVHSREPVRPERAERGVRLRAARETAAA